METHRIRPSGPLDVYPMANARRDRDQAPPRVAAKVGYLSPEMSRAPRNGVRFSVKLLWARWAVSVQRSRSVILVPEVINMSAYRS